MTRSRPPVAIIGFIGLALSLSACGSNEENRPPTPDPTTQRQVEQGALVGYRAENDAQVWRGLPFAAPPIDDLRWRAPRPALAWTGTREAIDPAPRCLQLTNAFDQAEGLEPGQLVGAEDCLYLDIYAPANATVDDRLPVMMWIHGGGNAWGRASQFDGSKLAENEDVIVVAIQYRLGPLGWFAHPLLQADAKTPLDQSPNFATLDMIAALQWIRDNIESFGGDPDLVTIFGESAGGRNVASLLGSDLAQGLFHRAILQSGSWATTPMADAQGLGDEYANSPLKVVARAGINPETAAALRAIDMQTFFDAHEKGPGFLGVHTNIADGIVLPEQPLVKVIAERPVDQRIPIISGTNRDEMKLFNLFNPDLTEQILWVFIQPKDDALYNAVAEYQSREWRLRAVDDPFRTLDQAGHDQLYGYRFDWDDGGSFLFMDTAVLVGAAHSVEIPFVFNHFEFFGPRLDPLLFNDDNADGRQQLADKMGALWAEFARTGDAADWPAWADGRNGQAPVLLLDSQNDEGIRPIYQEETLARLIDDLISDARLTTTWKCRIIADYGWQAAEGVPSDLCTDAATATR